jgi:hypothetical protein
MIPTVDFEIDASAVPSGMGAFNLHLYDATPTAIADNAVFNLIAADRSKYLGSISISLPTDKGDTLWSHNDGVNFISKFATASSTLYGILETSAAYTPTASIVKKIALCVIPM